jgi:hypothetical protein
MAHQQLDGAQVGTGFEQMRGEAMPERMRAKLLLNAGAGGRRPADVPYGLVGDGPLDVAIADLAGEQIDAGLLPSPVVAQGFEQLRRQGHVTIAHPLTPLDMDDHALAVDIAHLQQSRLGAAHAGGIEQHQEHAMHAVRRRLDQPRHFVLTEHGGQRPRLLGEGQIVESQIAPLQRLLVEKPQGGDAVLHRAQGQLPLVKQVNLIAPQLFGAQLLRGAAEILGELLYGPDVAADGIGRIVAPPEIVQHALTESGHRNLLPMTTHASPAVSPSLHHHSPSAAPAA